MKVRQVSIRSRGIQAARLNPSIGYLRTVGLLDLLQAVENLRQPRSSQG